VVAGQVLAVWEGVAELGLLPSSVVSMLVFSGLGCSMVSRSFA
jgi:hypothetical protein